MTPWGQRTEGEWRARWVTRAGAAPPSTGSKLMTLGTEGEEHLRSRGRTISLEDPRWEEGPPAGSGLAGVLLAGREPQAPLPNPTVQWAALRVRAPGRAPTLRRGARCKRAPTPAPGAESARLAQRAWPSRPCLEETLSPGMPCLMGRPGSLGPPVRMESLRTWFGVKALGHQRQPTRRPGSTTFHRERGPQGPVGVVTH